MKTIFDNLQENLSVAIELLSHTLKIAKDRAEIIAGVINENPAILEIIAQNNPKKEGIKESIEVKIVPDKLETVKEREPENKTQLEKEVDDWTMDSGELVKVKIGNGFFVCKDIKAIEISVSKKSATVYLDDSRIVSVSCP